MRRYIDGWTGLFTKLGLAHERTRFGRARNSHSRSLRLEGLEDRRVLAVLTVNANVDNTTADSSLTMREAVAIVNAGTTNGVIPDLSRTLTVGEKALVNTTTAFGTNDKIQFTSAGTILLNSATGQIEIGRSVIIDATGLPTNVTVNAQDPSPNSHTGEGIRIFNITDSSGGGSPPLVQLIHLTLTGADVGDFDRAGGAIRSQGQLIIRHCTIEDNEADLGGAVFVQVAGGSLLTQRQVLTVEDSVIQNNTAFTGGGIDVISGDTGAPTADTILITSRTTIANNHALGTFGFGGGGGVYAKLHGARLTVSESTISGNTAAASGGSFSFYGGGGGIDAELHESASLTIDKTVVDGNTATYGDGGGILAVTPLYNDNFSNPYPTPRAITITRSTISNNMANDRGGGLFAFNRAGTETLVSESRITGNHVPAAANGSHRNVNAG